MKLLRSLKFIITTTVIYVVFILLSTFLTINTVPPYNVNHELLKPSVNFETDCRFQPKRCIDDSSCDCSKMCNNSAAKLVNINEGSSISFVFNKLLSGLYCYIPTGNDCHEDFSTWKFDKHFKCLPKYLGVFNTAGKQIVGKYPHFNPNQLLKKIDSVDYNKPNTFEV